jgi:hypothetical protein
MKFLFWARYCSTVVKQLTINKKCEGSNLADSGTGRKIILKNIKIGSKIEPVINVLLHR